MIILIKRHSPVSIIASNGCAAWKQQNNPKRWSVSRRPQPTEHNWKYMGYCTDWKAGLNVWLAGNWWTKKMNNNKKTGWKLLRWWLQYRTTSTHNNWWVLKLPNLWSSLPYTWFQFQTPGFGWILASEFCMQKSTLCIIY